MMKDVKSKAFAWIAGAAAVAAASAMFTVSGHAQSKEPIKIGFSMAQTGPLGPNGQQALLGMKIWEEETNAKGGLLGRPVKLVYYDDQSNPSTVPGIYTKLLDVDKVDLVVSGYATNMVAPAMPIVIQRKKTFISLFALDVNAQFKYPKYFSVLPTGPKTKSSFTEGFYQVAMQQNPKPKTVALTYEDAEFSQNACEGARENAKTFGVKIVYDKSFPFNSPDLSPVVRALQASNADIVVVCSYPLSSVNMVQAVKEANYNPKMIGGAMVGLQATVFKNKLGPKLNGIVNYETWVPTEKMMAPAAAFFKKYQALAAGGEGRSARLLSRWLGLRLHQHVGRGDCRDQERQRRQDRRLAAQDPAQDHHGRLELRPGRRVDQVRHDAGAISRHQGRRRPRCLERHELPDRADAGLAGDRQSGLSIRKSEVS